MWEEGGAEGRPSGSSNQERNEEGEDLPGGRSERREAARKEARDGAGRRRFTDAQRHALLDQLEASGQTVSEFSAGHGLCDSTVYTWLQQSRRAGIARQTKHHRSTYTAEERRAAVEAFARSGRTRAEFAKLWGVSGTTLATWLKRHKQGGGKALEAGPGGPGRPRTIPTEVREAIAQTKKRFPDFGLRKVRDWLLRFNGIRVSAGTVRSTLKENGIGPPPTQKKRRAPPLPRRFERARPMQLWQTDITSYVLTRHSTRVYLIVFLDDRSRYLVSWLLCNRATAEMVQECLLRGIASFGKPEEVLSDQGPQYYSWRGRSAFQKILMREGIRHVVARTHHPQTLGKCERLWKTVREELWERARPQDLDEARERLGHYFAHYNHFRPHQGIDGMVPADRFFGAENALRLTLEAQMAANELKLALDLPPRRPVYLFGQIGDQQVSLVGEHGRLVVHTEDGAVRELEEVRHSGIGNAESNDDREQSNRDRVTGPSGDRVQADQDRPQEEPLSRPSLSGALSAGTVAGGESGATNASPRAVDGDLGVLAGQVLQGGDRSKTERPASESLAALAARALWNAGGTASPAQGETAALPVCSTGAGGRPQDPAAAHLGLGAQALTDRGPGAGTEGPALGSEVGRAPGGEPCEAAAQRRPAAEEAAWAFGIPTS